MSDLTPDWPAITDDDGTGRTGTPLTKAGVWDVIKAAINSQLYSLANPLVKAKDIIDEIIAARGLVGSLSLRLAGVISTAGAFIVPTTVASAVQAGSLPSGNLVENGDFRIWTDGDTNAPTGWTKMGAFTLSRAGAGGAAQLTHGAENSINLGGVQVGGSKGFYQDILNTTEFARSLGLRGRKIAFGSRIWAGSGRIGVSIYDGVNRTTVYHPEDSTEHWVNGVHTISGGATFIRIELNFDGVNGTGPADWGVATAAFSDVPLSDFILPEMQSGVIHFAGTSAVATGVNRYIPGRMGIVTGVLLHGAPGANSVSTDVTNWDQAVPGSVSIFSGGGPVLTNVSPFAFKAPNGTYYRRCFRAPDALAGLNGEILSFDITADTTGGILLTTEIRVMQYIRPLEAIKDHLI